MSTAEQLADLLREFPGIGPRQARRFVYFLLTRDPSFIQKLTLSLSELKQSMRVCLECFRFYAKEGKENGTCTVCRDKNRDGRMLMIVPRDVDYENIEKSGTYHGLYFVLGGTVPILEKEPERRIRLRELKARIERDLKKVGDGRLLEIILGMSFNPEGENTATYVQNEVKNLPSAVGLKISHLGRGLSTGTELEYSNSETLKNALENRR